MEPTEGGPVRACIVPSLGLEIRMGWAHNTPVARRYIQLAQEQEALAEMQAALSPLRAMARLRRPRA